LKTSDKQVEEKFTWVPTYEEIVEFLRDKKDKQEELIQILDDIGVRGLNDKDEENNIIRLEEIDPFTFFCLLNTSSKNRIELHKKLAEKISSPEPKDDLGLPSVMALNAWCFPIKKDRNNNEISLLWECFYKVLDNNINDTIFKDVLNIKSMGKATLTSVLFYVNPRKYFPINEPTIPYLKEKLHINPEFNTYSDYKNILNQIRDKTNEPFYKISYKAWLWNNRKEKNYDLENGKKGEFFRNKNIILYGPPGTGKTFDTKRKALNILEKKYNYFEEINKEKSTVEKDTDSTGSTASFDEIPEHPNEIYTKLIEFLKTLKITKLTIKDSMVGFYSYSDRSKRNMGLVWLEYPEKNSNVRIHFRKPRESNYPQQYINSLSNYEESAWGGYPATRLKDKSKIGVVKKIIKYAYKYF